MASSARQGRPSWLRQVLAGFLECLFSGKEFDPVEFVVVAVSLLDRGVEHGATGFPDFRSDAVPSM